MDSLVAFNDAITRFNECKQVRRLNGANSVWEVSDQFGALCVLKYFPKNSHGELHYNLESGFLKVNKHLDFIPEIIEWSDEDSLMILDHYESVNESKVTFESILEVLQRQFFNLRLPNHRHEELPGILGWWKKGLSNLNPSQFALLDYLREQSWFLHSMELITDTWSDQVPIHGDLKLENICMGRREFKIIDWEIVGVGLSSWDQAGLLQSAICHVLREGRFYNWVRQNSEGIEAYFQNSNDEQRSALILRLTQSAIERSNVSVPAPVDVGMLCQIASNIFDQSFSMKDFLS